VIAYSEASLALSITRDRKACCTAGKELRVDAEFLDLTHQERGVHNIGDHINNIRVSCLHF